MSDTYKHQNGTTITRHPNGSTTAAYSDNGRNVTIATGPGCTPTDVRVAFTALSPELMPGKWREPDPEAPLCRFIWPDPDDTLGRPHVCGLLGQHEGPHQSIGYSTSYYDDEGVWHNGGRYVLAEAPNA